jgi:predicted phage terminase large subunit-like protein
MGMAWATRIRARIDEHRPIIVRRETSEILAGNHTYQAAQLLGWDTILVTYLDGLTDAQARKIVLVDNKTNDAAGYDDHALAQLLAELEGDHTGTGFEEDEIAGLLSHLSPLERARLEAGDWDVADEGEVFQRHWFELVPRLPNRQGLELCRYWDLAATAAAKGKDPDWTAGALVAVDRASGEWFIVHIVRIKGTPGTVEKLVVQTAEADTAQFGRIKIRMEEEGGSSGKNTIHTYKKLLLGHDFRGMPSRTSKLERARPVASAAEDGYVKMIGGAWNQDYLDEAAGFPTLPHDDQVDAVDGAFEALAFPVRTKTRILV